MPELPETTGRTVADLPQRMGLSQLTEKHRHIMTPTGKPLGGVFCAGKLDEPFKFQPRKKG
jgi:hypothetical protein